LKQLYKSSKDNTSIWVEKICYWFIEQFKETSSGLNDPTFSKETNQGRLKNINLKTIFIKIISCQKNIQ
jgi:hypothetical protein